MIAKRIRANFGASLFAGLSVFLSAAAADDNVTPPGYQGMLHTCVPPGMYDETISGDTVLSLRIAVDGTTKDITVLKSSGRADYDRQAIECVRDWLFHPATQDGKPVEVPWKVQIDWKLFVQQVK